MGDLCVFLIRRFAVALLRRFIAVSTAMILSGWRYAGICVESTSIRRPAAGLLNLDVESLDIGLR